MGARLKRPRRAKIHRDFKFIQFIRGGRQILTMCGYFIPEPIRADLRFGLGPAKIALRERQLMVKHILTYEIRQRSRRERAKKTKKNAKKKQKKSKKKQKKIKKKAKKKQKKSKK